MKIVIVEDEKASQQYLQNLLERRFPHMTIAAVTDNVPDAAALIRLHLPDIVFLDIEIRMGTAFDVLSRLDNTTAELIFTTAFNQFAIDAFRHHAMDYLLKPLEDEQVADAVKRCERRILERNSVQQLSGLLQYLQKPAQRTRIGIHTVDGIAFIDTNDIVFAAAKGNYTELKLSTGARITASRKLKDMEQQLAAPQFFRIHHSYVVNTHYVKKYVRGRGGYIILTDDSSLPISVARKDDFLKNLGQ